MQVAPLVLAAAALVAAVLALAWTFALAQRVRGMAATRGDLARSAAAGDFQSFAAEVTAQIESLRATDAALAADDAALAERVSMAVRNVGIVRFDALPGDVGENSFSVALLDDHASGFVLTSMYGRGAYRLYAKPVVEGVSQLVLTGEEAAAAATALEGTGLSVAGEDRRTRGA